MKTTEHLEKIDEMLEKRSQEEKKQQLFNTPTPDLSSFPTNAPQTDALDIM